MKRIAIANLMTAASNVAAFADKIARSSAGVADTGLIQVSLLSLRDLGRVYVMSLAQIADTAEQLDLPATMACVSRCKTAYGRLTGGGGLTIGKGVLNEIVTNSHHLTTSLSDELDNHHAYIVAPREAELIDNGIGLFGLEVVNALPAIRQDVSQGAQCRAYELWTASVMHMMRVAEIGVAALADHLGVTRGSSWGVTIANVLQALDAQRKAKGNAEQKQWASEMATYLNFVKDAFRNPAMHPEMNFDREQAISIYDNTRAFMRMLVKRLAEEDAA